MSLRMQRNLGLLELYKTPSVRRVIVGKASPDFINALCEIALNVLSGNIPLTDKYKLLKRRRAIIRLVADKKVKLLKKEKEYQSGGFLLPLLGAAIPL